MSKTYSSFVRSVATAPKSKSYRAKTFSEVWLSDVGAYPIMSVIGFAVLFSTGTGLYFMSTMPDARLSKSSRKSIFRGELKGEE